MRALLITILISILLTSCKTTPTPNINEDIELFLNGRGAGVEILVW